MTAAPRECLEPMVMLWPAPEHLPGSTHANTTGLDGIHLASLNVALARLIDPGLTEHDANLWIDMAVHVWLEPDNAADAELERPLAWR